MNIEVASGPLKPFWGLKQEILGYFFVFQKSKESWKVLTKAIYFLLFFWDTKL